MNMSVSSSTAQPAALVPVGSPVSAASTASAAAKVAVVEPVAPAQAQAKPEREELEAAVKSIQDFADSGQRNLKFSIDEKSNQVVVKVIATDTGVVVRQIPDEAAIKLAEKMKDTGSLILDEKA
jgi:flagellar protein FlaG